MAFFYRVIFILFYGLVPLIFESGMTSFKIKRRGGKHPAFLVQMIIIFTVDIIGRIVSRSSLNRRKTRLQFVRLC
jgi:hypothetical protein